MIHQEKHLRSSDFITDVVIGMSDGLTVPFALAAGISSAVNSNQIVTTAGIAEVIAGSIAMGLGGYLAGKTELDHYQSELRREYQEVEMVPEKEKEEIKEIFADYGFSSEAQTMLANEIAKDKDKWVHFMMRYELGLEEPDAKRAGKSAATIGLSYVVGGLIPLLPYFFTDTPVEGLKISAAITLLSLFVFGYFKSKVTGQPAIGGAIRVMIIGAVAATAAYLVAKLFGA
ncbi:MAG: VIT1/CCC1 transporter family protein [Flavisolibacter sp.]|nr:VIT1/CCC1 transporter family protein [Flavisolibacter sp.]MBD0288189.1 VIT1/CCC1 transporter family protein [Flavisolibacter sp.]MBD0293943.1 VIT1/CCC1 transporter family protein [Flavisolibacter sp.]MBD0365486.1 VIT1/CCC1 transporter family protein [Flavisolibacter sp.]MBD0377251.1 VIT1/CCC1 transporter family protein [Flavisolibacter sp.]